MAKVKLKFNIEAFEHILGEASLPMIEAKAAEVAERCNAESSWGGYFHHSSIRPGGRAAGTVWSADNRNDEARDNRMVRNL